MADITFQFPDAPGAEIVIRTSFWRSPAILRDGLPLPRTGRGKATYLLTLPDGTQRRVRVAGFLNLSVEADGKSYPAERRLRWYEYLLVGIPLVLAVPGITGGAIGIGLGIAGVFVNARLARAVARPSLRAISMIGASACLFGIYLAAAVAVSLVIHPATPPSFVAGTCYNGPASPPAAADAYTETACTTAHDAEVIGTPVNPASTYPGEPALDAFANTACADAFKAYVGKPFDAAAEGMLVFTPSSAGWTQGDRTVVCLAVASEGQKLTGSLKGSAERSSTPAPSPIAGLPDGWVTYTAPDGSFSVGFPGEPYEKTSGTLPCADHEAGWVLSDRSTGYWVSFCDYPAGTMTDVIPTRMLESKQAAALDALGATLVTSKRIALDGHPGLEFTAVSQDGWSLAVRMYLVGDRLYKQDTNSKQPNASDIATFFDSLRFTSR